MFWKFDLHTASQLEKLLEKEDVTLLELLEEDDVLQECKAQNQRLLLFLSQDTNLQELISLITHEPPSDREEKLRYKYANTACELLTCDVSVINDKVGEDDSLLNTLYSFIEQQPPLNPLLTSFFSKTFGTLISRKPEQTISFLRKKEGFLALLLKHMDASAMMDLLLRLISCVEPVQLRHDVLIRQANVSQALCDIIRIGRDQTGLQELSDHNPLLTTLELQQSVDSLLKNMFEGERSEICIVNGTQVLLALLETRKSGVELIDPGSQASDQIFSVNNSILLGIEPHLKHYFNLLLHPPKGCRLINALLNTSAPRIHHQLCCLGVMDLLLDLFFKFTWNNFLHVQVEHCVVAILHQKTQDTALEDSPEPRDDRNTHTYTTYTPGMFTHRDLLTHIQQMTANFVDQFGFNDDEFGEHDDGINSAFSRIGGIKCNLVDEGPSAGAFQSCVKEKLRAFDDEEEDIWEDKEINYATQVKSRTRFGVTSALRSDGEDRTLRCLGLPNLECSQDCKEILDSSSSKDGDRDSSLPQNFAGVAIDSGSGVWGNTTAPLTDSEDKGWATFTDFQPFCCSDSGARCSSPDDPENLEKQNQNKDARGSAACVWSVCGAKKAPLVASDSSSSGSDSEDEEERSDGDKENITGGVDNKPEKTLCNR
ncbi:Serine/threonine-protein phosphatase 6 regulatory subunit 2 [Bagarius yarrelli]|uniref:Serine/threonine-protein phosphatase 6 regulatory subunit 2 n=1 Tax=Bagarius yarrelli TaxID=175774 RepID=A0A556VKL4_BAGYA|nr:Serine/threonine-protein phosphatase 6 regulatory subunit 2 [Bagarius yarrelli]